MALSPSFIAKVAQLIGADPAFLSGFLQEWARWEGMPDWANNPLATTQNFGDLNLNQSFDIGYGPGKWNDANAGMGVKVYADEDSGAAATARMILNGNFPSLVASLQSGQVTPGAVADLRKWGTTGFANQLDGGAGIGEPSVEETQYWEKRSQLDALVKQYGLLYDPKNGGVTRDSYTGGLVQDPTFRKTMPLTMDIVGQIIGLENELANFEDSMGMASPSDIRGAYDFWNSTDPRVIDAENAANRYGREYNARVQAASGAANAMQDQLGLVDAASKTRMGWSEDSQGRRQPGSNFGIAPPAKMKSGDELFQEALNRIKAGLPEVPDLPYPSRPSGGPAGILSGGMPQRPPAARVAAASVGAGGPGGAMRPTIEGAGSGRISGSIMQPAGASATYGTATPIEPPARLTFMDRLRGKLPTVPTTNLGTAPWKRGSAGGGF